MSEGNAVREIAVLQRKMARLASLYDGRGDGWCKKRKQSGVV